VKIIDIDQLTKIIVGELVVVNLATEDYPEAAITVLEAKNIQVQHHPNSLHSDTQATEALLGITPLSAVMMLLQLGMSTAMVKSAAHATGGAASGMSSDNFGAKVGGRLSGSKRSSRRVTLYCHINFMLHKNQGVGSGDQSSVTSKLQAI
jgi:hypothetical protein